MEPSKDAPSRVAFRALELLGTFGVRTRRQSLSEMSVRSGIPLATAYRLAKVLTEWGALERSSDRRYEIGRRLWELGLLADVQIEVRQIAAPFLQDLFVTTREAVYLAIREGTTALYVDRLSGSIAPKVHAQVGSRLPLHATGVGKVLLAHAPSEVTEKVMANLGKYTPYTLVERAKLEKELGVVKRRGYARTLQEMDLMTAAIAVPIVDSAGRVDASLGIVTSDLRKDLSRLLPALQVAAQGIGRSLPSENHVN